MNDEKKDFEWNPPSPPWQSEPEPLSLKTVPDKDPEPEPEPEPVNAGLEELIEEMEKDGDLGYVPIILFNGKPVKEEFSKKSEDQNGDELDGFFFYRIKCATGITLNGKHFDAGAYWFDRPTFESMEIIDKPYQ